jgi:hypothetical protein
MDSFPVSFLFLKTVSTWVMNERVATGLSTGISETFQIMRHDLLHHTLLFYINKKDGEVIHEFGLCSALALPPKTPAKDLTCGCLCLLKPTCNAAYVV